MAYYAAIILGLLVLLMIAHGLQGLERCQNRKSMKIIHNFYDMVEPTATSAQSKSARV